MDLTMDPQMAKKALSPKFMTMDAKTRETTYPSQLDSNEKRFN
jgi:hypothetical protein